MHSREVVDVLTDDDAEVLEAHPVDALVNGRDELDERDRSPVEDIERLGEHDLGDRTPVPDVLAVRARMALEKRALVDVKVPIGDADGEVAERVGRDVDAAGNKTVALHRREGSIVPDDLGDRIRRRHVASCSAIVRDCTAGHTVPGWSYSGSQLPGATLLRTRSTSASERSRSSSSRDIPAHSGRRATTHAVGCAGSAKNLMQLPSSSVIVSCRRALESAPSSSRDSPRAASAV